MGVCVKDLSWHPDEEPIPQEMTGNSKRVTEGGWVKQLGKHGGLSTEFLSSGAKHSENGKMKFDFQVISRKCSTRGELYCRHKTNRTAA